MVKFKDEATISYPVRLYHTTKQHLINIIGSLFLCTLGYFATSIAKQEGAWVMFSIGWLLMIGGGFGFAVLSYAWLNKKPIVTIERAGLSFLHILKPNQQHLILWQDIKNVDLHSWTRGHINYWILIIHTTSHSFAKEKVIRQPLKPMYFEHLILNEKEVYYLLEQAFAGQTELIYKRINMNLSDRLVSNFSFWFIWTILVIGLSTLLWVFVFA